MRFIRRELSPANKKQYLLALGKRDLELLLGMAVATHRNLPVVDSYKNDRHRIGSAIKTLKEAILIAAEDGDDGDVVPVPLRAEFQRANPRRPDPMSLITRVEVIRDIECPTCKGWGLEKIDKSITDNLGNLHTCGLCGGLGNAGREVVLNDSTKIVESSIQDGGKTLKLFIKERPKLKRGEENCETGKAISSLMIDSAFVERLRNLSRPD